MTTLILALRDGAILAAAATVLVMGTLRANPRLLMRHYPQELREHVTPMTGRERGASKLIGLLLIGLLVGGPWLSTRALTQQVAGLSFAALFLHAFVVGLVFNVVDWLLLDELWLGVLRPRWAMLPGAEDVPFRFNHAQHFRGFVVGSVLAALVAVVVAGVVRR